MPSYPLTSRLTVGQLKAILADMADDAIVCARDRDCISLDQVHVVGPLDQLSKHRSPPEFREYGGQKHELRGLVRVVASLEEVYGGRGNHLENPSKQAIIFCDCD